MLSQRRHSGGSVFICLTIDVLIDQFLASYTSGAVAVSHDQVQCSTSLTPVAVHTAAAVMKNLLTQVSTLLGFLLKQQVTKLKKNYRISHIFNIT